MLAYNIPAFVACFCLLFIYGVPAVRNHLARKRVSRERGCQPPPSVAQKDPIFGLDVVLQLFRSYEGGRRNVAFKKQIETYGSTFQWKTYGTTRIFTIEPDNLRAVFSTDFKNWGLQPLRLGPWEPFVGKGIMDSDGAFWKHSRALIQPTFSREQIADLESFDVHLQRMLELIPRDGTTTVDMQPLFARLILDVSTEFLFGESVECLTTKTTLDATSFLKAFNYGQAGIGKRLQLPQWTLFTRDEKFWSSCKIARDFVDKYVDQALRRSECPTPDKPGKYILAWELAKETKNRDDIRNQLLNVFLPGHDAIAVLLTNCFFNLARHPEVYAKLRQEIIPLGDSELTFDRIKSLKYLRSVIDETFRLTPTVGQTARIALHDTVLPTGGGPTGTAPMYVKKGSNVQMNFYALHKRVEVYGADAEVFRPERWQSLKLSHWDYLPFGGGPRICPAQHMTFAQAGFTIVRILQQFRAIENRDPCHEFIEQYKISTESKNGAKLVLIPV